MYIYTKRYVFNSPDADNEHLCYKLVSDLSDGHKAFIEQALESGVTNMTVEELCRYHCDSLGVVVPVIKDGSRVFMSVDENAEFLEKGGEE